MNTMLTYFVMSNCCFKNSQKMFSFKLDHFVSWLKNLNQKPSQQINHRFTRIKIEKNIQIFCYNSLKITRFINLCQLERFYNIKYFEAFAR